MLHSLFPLKPYRNEINIKLLAHEIRAAWSHLRSSPHWAPLANEITALYKRIPKPCKGNFSDDTITLELPTSITPPGFESLLKSLSPWRVGPYQVGTALIDSEWRSYMKWHRIAPLIGEIQGDRVADVGSSSGYFLFRLAALDPKLVVGFDPIERCWLQHSLLQALAKVPSMAFVPTGISTLDAFPEFFDLVLCMGVIYHQRDPFTACKKLYSAVRPGGRVILESMVIPESGSHMLVPRERYAKMRNAWIIPTPEALETLLMRAGFKHTTIQSYGPITTSEQRRTDWAPYESLADFLDPTDPTKTVEGYPAPHSALVVATKGA